MDFKEYQKLASRTAAFNDNSAVSPLVYLALGVAGESGEVVEKIKKIVRNDGGKVSSEKKEELKKELGDVLWYLSQMAQVLGYNFEEVAKTNIEKLASRKNRGVICSEGDNR